jgi:hypothetical protein
MNETPLLPCIECITMAICNSYVHQRDKYEASLTLYLRCKILHSFIDKHFTTQEDSSVQVISLNPISLFFFKTELEFNNITKNKDPLYRPLCNICKDRNIE